MTATQKVVYWMFWGTVTALLVAFAGMWLGALVAFARLFPIWLGAI